MLLRYIEKVAIAWAEAGITTPAQAEGHVSRYDKNVYSIMNALGKTNTPARNELAYIRRWTEEFCFELDVILEACGRTVLATDRHRFAYADSILAAWYKAGVPPCRGHRQTRQLLSERACISPGAPAGLTAEYNSFLHSSYDFDALEEALLNAVRRFDVALTVSPIQFHPAAIRRTSDPQPPSARSTAASHL